MPTKKTDELPIADIGKSFVSAYGQKKRVQLHCPAPGRTKQSFAAECDINTIMARYMKTGVLEHVREDIAQYLDVSGVDFQKSMDLVAGAQSMFHSLPSHIRTKFDNSPRAFLEFMENPANAQEAISLGLATAQAEPSIPPSGGDGRAAPTPLPAQRQASLVADADGVIAEPAKK